MDNQHRQITGYRDLTQPEIDLINGIKNMAEGVGAMVADLQGMEGPDQRWVSIGATNLQQGFMALVRSMAKPESF